ERLDPLFERVALIGKGKVGALRPASARNAPGDRPVVGHPHDQAALCAHETRGFRHFRSPGRLPPMAQCAWGPQAGGVLAEYFAILGCWSKESSSSQTSARDLI